MDVTTVERVAALCSSDEETEDMSSLQFLPISPEVEDPEEGSATSGIPASSGTGGQENDKQRSKENASPTPAKKRKYKSYEIKLEGAPKDGKLKIQVFCTDKVFILVIS